MTRPSRRVRRLANLGCNNCEHQYWGSTIGIDRDFGSGTVGGNPDKDGARGNVCPRCGSEFIRVLG